MILADCGIESPDVHQRVTDACNPFEGLTTRHLREKYYKDNFHYQVTIFSRMIVLTTLQYYSMHRSLHQY